MDTRYRLNTAGEFDDRPDYLRLDTTDLSVSAAADRIITYFEL